MIQFPNLLDILIHYISGLHIQIALSARADLQSDRSEYKHLKCDLRTAARPPVACYRKDSKWRHVTHPSPCH